MSWAGPFQYEIGKSRQAHLSSTGFDAAAREHFPTLLCLSHLRWNFVYQRPQHLMSRFARDYNVLFFEEPLPTDDPNPWLEEIDADLGITRLVPRFPVGLEGEAAEAVLKRLLDRRLEEADIQEAVLWYYTPMSLPFSQHIKASITVYDCMDELSAFRGAPPAMLERERQLLEKANVVFTGGYSLYEAKRERHKNAHPFPSSVDIAHFAQAREEQADPADQAAIPHPRLGFYGVIDERLDIDLLDTIAQQRPDWHIVLIGPVVKIAPESLPKRDNIHLLGGKVYDELPHYLAGWDVAIMPFALNESTRFISPTKTPEYLAGGKPVVSTPITDVVRTYGQSGVVRIADSAEAFISAVEASLVDAQDREGLLKAADAILGEMSWDTTWQGMTEQMKCAR
ncbi:glycosyl transferase family 1 [Pseudomonas duriflava]|uniref:Glycosyl transferase family 1 n=1 Tax=Pseudomonas duriflava TaxID=459528 RepID=A0A562Q7Q3_9PSED|nr:glycosyltransferase family 1 protein [Pseudomonas duriflava]TWI52791.1 glycosyl transferase family 1 [Pseudomonas duriflava]